MKLVAALEEMLTWLAAQGYSPATIRLRRLYGRDFVGFLRSQGLEDVEEVGRSHVADWQAWVWRRRNRHTGRPLSDTTRVHHLEAVRLLFRFLLGRKLLSIDPAAALETPKWKESPPKDIPTVEEMEVALSRPDTGTLTGLRDRALLELAYSTGLRREELADLEVQDVDLVERVVRVRAGKGGKGRTAPLTGTACEYLGRYMREARAAMVEEGGRGQEGRREPALWLTCLGGRMTKGSLGHTVARYVRMGRPGTGSACHAIRHAFATHMLQGGADIRAVQMILGHASVETTERYLRVKPVDLKAAHRRHHPRGKKESERINP